MYIKRISEFFIWGLLMSRFPDLSAAPLNVQTDIKSKKISKPGIDFWYGTLLQELVARYLDIFTVYIIFHRDPRNPAYNLWEVKKGK